ncbi:SDR family NAD(P)-dependent oxidoreductase [Hahella sp. KA22]|uniref:SDR family NAD(P)-dependent oxidoreductase n=1 Tax=Hahella sp. KA22 TaxID=1628392 RepID=UPI000FDE1B49|nr:SDR family NAD(P)-dependent oxidoreductase [Hahella sp. KA22]AZZ95229.1 SDR family NAD(P)-dependent oxidoreductase [Hahella sp. KA22]QAY52874.1 SDR family NAD(P)-dependent oxidoreductase [Hahella sp. KA22]
MSDGKNKTWFITGASRGLGYEIAVAALAAGENVVATGRNLDALRKVYESDDRLLLLALDVCSQSQAADCAKQAVARFGGVDVLVNNAGYGQLGVFEEVATDRISAQFETNVFGLMDVTRAILPYMREQRKGRIFNISSIGGAIGFEGASAYCASKFAIEGFSECLAVEVKQFGIGVTLVQPGFFRTDFLDDSSISYGDLRVSDYEQYSTAVMAGYRIRNHQQAGDPAKLGEALVKLSREENCPLRFAAGSDAVQYLSQAYSARQSELDQWASLSVSTDILE